MVALVVVAAAPIPILTIAIVVSILVIAIVIAIAVAMVESSILLVPMIVIISPILPPIVVIIFSRLLGMVLVQQVQSLPGLLIIRFAFHEELEKVLEYTGVFVEVMLSISLMLLRIIGVSFGVFGVRSCQQSVNEISKVNRSPKQVSRRPGR
jgi:hypothetical protein